MDQFSDKTPKPINLSSIENEIIPDKTQSNEKIVTSETSDLADIEILPQYEFILEAIKVGCPSFFVTGKAGTGKSTLIKWLTTQLEGCAVVCPTAIAAVNVNGETIHSFFGLPPVHLNSDEKFHPRPKTRSLLANLKYLIIDEVSMVLPNIVDVINKLLQQIRNSSEPFGGVPTLFIGDLLQLPPVVASQEEAIYFSHRYKTPYFFSADIFRHQEIIPVSLTEVRRQSDLRFIEALNHIRLNRDHRDHVALFNRDCFRDKVHDGVAEDTVLVPTNAAAKQINTRKLNTLVSRISAYDAEVTGSLPANKWKLPVPDRLELKVGAKVIFLKNDKPQWVNGDIAEVVALADDFIRVKKAGTDNIVVVARAEWQKFKYNYNYDSKKIEREEAGTFKQFPLALGWAITIHKSQGMTLERLTLDLGSGAFCEGQTYVALSRAKTIGGITLARPIRMSDVKADVTVLAFYKQMGLEA